MYERILVPIDNSECSEIVLTHAFYLATLCTAELTFLHVLNPSDTEEERIRSEEVLNAVKARAQTKALEAKTRLVIAGQPLAAILQIEEDYDLIIIATHGRQGADRLVMGSVSEGIIRQSRKPHLVLRCETESSFDLVDFYRQSAETEVF